MPCSLLRFLSARFCSAVFSSLTKMSDSTMDGFANEILLTSFPVGLLPLIKFLKVAEKSSSWNDTVRLLSRFLLPGEPVLGVEIVSAFDSTEAGAINMLGLRKIDLCLSRSGTISADSS